MGETTMADLKLGQKAEVIRFADDSVATQRMEEMGINPGEEVELVRLAPFGDPMEIRIRGYLLSLRKEEAKLIKVKT